MSGGTILVAVSASSTPCGVESLAEAKRGLKAALPGPPQR